MDNEFIKNITEEGDNVMRILFICGNGVSSGMIASRTGKAGKAQGYDVDTEAYSYTELSEVIDDFDVVLAAPQMKCNEEMIRETCEEHGKKYAIIDNYEILYEITGLAGRSIFTENAEVYAEPVYACASGVFYDNSAYDYGWFIGKSG